MMWCVQEDATRDRRGRRHALQRRDSARAAPRAMHAAGVKLEDTVCVR